MLIQRHSTNVYMLFAEYKHGQPNSIHYHLHTDESMSKIKLWS